MTEALFSELPPDFPWRETILYFDTIDSTNTRAKDLSAQGAPEGTILIADQQTGGRGRRGRSFQSPPGVGVYLSVLLRPNCTAGELLHLTCATAEAMCDAVEEAASFRPGIKWTNDLVYGGRKLAGILTELMLEPGSDRVSAAIIGIGVNCCQRLPDFPPELRDMAGSLTMASGQPVSRSHLAAAMIQSLYRMSSVLLTGKKELMARYRADCVTIGRQISLVRGDEVRHGLAVGVDEDGELLVEFTPGQTEAVSSGEVSVRGMYGYL